MDLVKADAHVGITAAKRMITSKDYKGAKNKLLEVQKQVGDQDLIVSGMICLCRILSDAQLTLNNSESDWYWVLQLGPGATVFKIKSQYQKFTELLEPIKNDVPGTSTALRLLDDAVSVLSNPQRRLVYDSGRLSSWGDTEFLKAQGSSPLQIEQAIPDKRDPLVKVGVSLFRGVSVLEKIAEVVDLTDPRDSDILNNMSEACQIMPASAHQDDIPFPRLEEIASQRSSFGIFDFHDFNDLRNPGSFKIGQVWAAYDDEKLPRRYAIVNGLCKSPFQVDVTWLRPIPGNDDEGKWCRAGLPVSCRRFHLRGASESLTQCSVFSHLVSHVSTLNHDEISIYPKEHEVWAIYEHWDPFKWCSDPTASKGCSLKLVEILEGYNSEQKTVEVASLEKVERFKNIFRRRAANDNGSRAVIPVRLFYKFSHNVPSYRFEGGEMDGVSHGMFELDHIAIKGASTFIVASSLRHSHVSSDFSPSPQPSEHSSNTGTSLEWTANDFEMDEVWAIYDCDNMPRHYVIVRKVISHSEVCATFLEPNPISNDEVHWVKEKLPMVCGSFKIGETTIDLKMTRFSHPVNCERNMRNTMFKIHPRKGEVWAVFRHWNNKWKYHDFQTSRYQVIEIISDFSESLGVQAVALEEVPAYLTFYQRKLSDGFELTRVVTTSDILCFSHRIESLKVPGIEAYGLPRECLHVEPKTLPPLLPVT